MNKYQISGNIINKKSVTLVILTGIITYLYTNSNNKKSKKFFKTFCSIFSLLTAVSDSVLCHKVKKEVNNKNTISKNNIELEKAVIIDL